MKIVVLVKDVPDTYGERTLNLETGLAERDKSDRVIDEIVERGLEFVSLLEVQRFCNRMVNRADEKGIAIRREDCRGRRANGSASAAHVFDNHRLA